MKRVALQRKRIDQTLNQLTKVNRVLKSQQRPIATALRNYGKAKVALNRNIVRLDRILETDPSIYGIGTEPPVRSMLSDFRFALEEERDRMRELEKELRKARAATCRRKGSNC